jgi:hypothetical protein
MVEAVWPAVRSDEELRKYYEEIKQRKGANLAKVAVAKRLLTNRRMAEEVLGVYGKIQERKPCKSIL